MAALLGRIEKFDGSKEAVCRAPRALLYGERDHRRRKETSCIFVGDRGYYLQDFTEQCLARETRRQDLC